MNPSASRTASSRSLACGHHLAIQNNEPSQPTRSRSEQLQKRTNPGLHQNRREETGLPVRARSLLAHRELECGQPSVMRRGQDSKWRSSAAVSAEHSRPNTACLARKQTPYPQTGQPYKPECTCQSAATGIFHRPWVRLQRSRYSAKACRPVPSAPIGREERRGLQRCGLHDQCQQIGGGGLPARCSRHRAAGMQQGKSPRSACDCEDFGL